MIKLTWKKELTDKEKLKQEVIDDLKDTFVNCHKDLLDWDDRQIKRIFNIPNFDNVQWIYQFYLQDDFICYLIKKSIINSLIKEIESNKDIDLISLLRNTIHNYKQYVYIGQPTKETSEEFVSLRFVKNDGWISSAFQNSKCENSLLTQFHNSLS